MTPGVSRGRWGRASGEYGPGRSGGWKYKVCCSRTGIDFTEGDAGTVRQSVPMPDDVTELLRVQRQKFVEQLGREPGPDDIVDRDGFGLRGRQP